MITKFKIFENNSDIKKYFISNFFGELAIQEILEIDKQKERAKIKLIYLYIGDKIINNSNSDTYYKSLNIIINKSLYNSDNLEKCIEVIKTLKDVSNYNL